MGSVAPPETAAREEQSSPQQRASAMEDPPQLPATTAGHSQSQSINSLDLRADPDAQATVTDFLDFTEYLPSDMVRSLTLIGKLDQAYGDASVGVNELATKWGQLPAFTPDERPSPAQLRADISEGLNQTVNSRVYSHAEAVRMAENVNRHYNRAKTILAKLQHMLENFSAQEEQKTPAANNKSPQLSRGRKITLRLEGPKARGPRIPRITVPGEVLAPYDINYETYSGESESSSEEAEEDETPVPPRAQGGGTRIKLVKGPKTPKVLKIRKIRNSGATPIAASAGISTSNALAKLEPPPENAVIGSKDAPWLQLTSYELARLRKRMKKNAAWAPSDTMIARELKNLGRGIDAYKAAKQKAEEEGNPFEDPVPAPVVDTETGVEQLPPGALSAETTNEKALSNRGVKLNEAKKIKRDHLAKLAAEEAEESARRMADLARTMFNPTQTPSAQDQSAKPAAKGKSKKRKRDSVAEAEAEKLDASDPSSQRPPFKRTKTETPVPPPQLTPSTTNNSQPTQEASIPAPQLTPGGTPAIPHSTTPIPVPVPRQDQAASLSSSRSAASPTPSTSAVTSAVAKPAEAPAPPVQSPRKSATPILPPTRETRKTHATRKQEQQREEAATTQPIRAPSRTVTPAPATPLNADSEGPQPFPSAATTATTSTTATAPRRPTSRGKAASQEPQPSLAADRPRRTSTARNTPAPERPEQNSRPVSRRSKRPAPGVISRTKSGGNSAVGKRKAAPRKKSARASKRDKGAPDAAGGGEILEVEVDDEGNVIDPDEPRYCLCNGVSFGLMIQCDNVDVSYAVILLYVP